MNSKTYKLPNGKKAVFEYDENGVGKITLKCMDMLMGLINDRKTEPQTDCRDCGYAWWNSDAKRYECMMKKCRYDAEPQTEREGE